MEYVNLTEHPIVVRDHDDVTTTYPPSGTVARIQENATSSPSPDMHRRAVVTLGEVTGLPAPREGVTYVVSMPTAMALLASGRRRDDVVYPYHLYRDEDGRIVGADMLARLTTEGAA